MKITGQIYKIGDTQVVSEKFSKREMIIKTEMNTPYPQYIKVEFTQDKTSLLDTYKVNDEVGVEVNLRGRLFNGEKGEQCFVTLQAWRIESYSTATVAEVKADVVSNDNDPLPF